MTTPALISATYDNVSHVLQVTATGMMAGDTIDVSKLILNGAGICWMTSGNVTASSSTDFAITLNAADIAATNQNFNEIGTTSTSGATYTLGGEANWDQTSGAVADLTGNGITVSVLSCLPLATRHIISSPGS